MAKETLEDKLAQFPLPVAVHFKRNMVCSIGAVVASVFPYVLLQKHMADWLFVLPSAKVASISDDAWNSIQTIAVTLGADWPFGEFRLLGWLVLPGTFAWFSISLDRFTDGKLDSTRKRYMEHLEHEAATAIATMTSQNLTREEAQNIAEQLIRLEPKQRHARMAFYLRQHDIGSVGFWPWLIALILVGIAVYFAFIDVDVSQSGLPNMLGLIVGEFIVLATWLRKTNRYLHTRLPIGIIRYFRHAVRNPGTVGAAI